MPFWYCRGCNLTPGDPTMDMNLLTYLASDSPRLMLAILGYREFERVFLLAKKYKLINSKLFLVKGDMMKEVLPAIERRKVLVDLH